MDVSMFNCARCVNSCTHFPPLPPNGKVSDLQTKGRRPDKKLLTASHVEGVEGCLKKLRSLVKMECEWRLKLTKVSKLGVVGGRAVSGTGVEA
jgi:hypothetical protein